jgi:hypothetical protein
VQQATQYNAVGTIQRNVKASPRQRGKEKEKRDKKDQL